MRASVAFWGRAIANERLRQLHRAYYQEISADLARHLNAHRPALSSDPAALADAVIAAIDGIGIRATLEPDEWPPERQKATLALMLAPLFARP